MSFGRQAYIHDGLILSFHIQHNFVPEKLPKFYKMFVQKQSITCMEKIYVHVIYFFNAKYLIVDGVVLRFYFSDLS